MGARLCEGEGQSQTGRFLASPNAALRDGLARDTRGTIELARVVGHIGIHDPRHFAFTGAGIGRRHVHARPDQVLFAQFVGVATGDPFELFDRVSARVDLHGAFCATERHIDHGALVSHEGGERLHL